MGKVVFMGFKGFLLRVAEIGKTAGNVQTGGLNTSSCCCLNSERTFGNSGSY